METGLKKPEAAERVSASAAFLVACKLVCFLPFTLIVRARYLYGHNRAGNVQYMPLSGDKERISFTVLVATGDSVAVA